MAKGRNCATGVVAALAGLATVALALHVTVSARSAPAREPANGASSQGAQTPHDIDSLVAPIALYPDQLLAQILLCAGDPPAVTKMNAWLKANQKLKGTELQDAAVLAGFEPSFVALALFPTVISSMAAKLEWTTLLGQVFAADRTIVFASIQKLRVQASEVGTLKSSPQQNVETKTTSSGEQVIVIEPTNPQVIYVPQYNSTVVYTQAPTTTTSTVVVEKDSSADAVAAGMIGFTAGIVIGAAVNNNYYYGPYGWHGGAYMYNDAWDDYYDAREDAREDWQDHREDLVEERGERAGNAQEQRTERQENRTENRPESQAQREQRKTEAQGARDQRQASGQTATTQARSAGTAEARGYSGGSAKAAPAERSGTKSDAFSGYSSGRSEGAASSRGKQSRSSSGSRGGGGRRR
jgi:hypothetical protein